jgi:subtilase family serine protease
MRTPVAVLAVIAAGLVVATAIVAGHASAAPAQSSPAAPSLATDAVPVPWGVGTAAMAPNATVLLSLTLANPHSEELSGFLAAIENPASSQYRDYLSYTEFLNAFSPSPAATARVANALTQAGGQDVAASPDRLIVSARLPVGAVDALFGVRMVTLHGVEGGRAFTTIGTPKLPPSLAGLVAGIDGFSNAPDFRLDIPLAPHGLVPVNGADRENEFIVNNSTGEPWFIGSDFTQAFRANQLLPGPSSIANATYPRHVAIATLLASGYNVSGPNVENTPPWDPRVIDAYFNDTLAPGWPHSNLTGVNLTVAGIPSPPPGYSPENDSSLDSFENSLDLEMAGSLAPGAPLYNFYFAGSLLNSATTDSDIAGFFVQDLSAALSYNYSSAGVRLGVVSCSFGISDLNDSGWNAELEEAAAMGVTVVAASGDQGNAPTNLNAQRNSQWPLWPATAAFNTSGALSVGGVTIGMSGSPLGWFNGTELNVSYDAAAGGIAQLSTWWNTEGGPGDYVGSEGGISTVNPEPDWQFRSAAQPNIVNATVQQGSSALGRAGPDIAFPANSTIAYVYANESGGVYFTLLQGTSIAAPAFAGFLADEVAVAHHAFGFVNPEIYRMASYFAAHPGPSNPFYDVRNGSNYFFGANPGWDATTGWGAPIAPLFYAADANSTIANFSYAGPTPVLPPAAAPPTVPWTEIILIFGVGVTVAIVLVLVMARPPKHPNAPPPPSAFGPLPPPAPNTFPTATYQGATFLCPYCGAVRPAEPVRCPRCGAL